MVTSVFHCFAAMLGTVSNTYYTWHNDSHLHLQITPLHGSGQYQCDLTKTTWTYRNGEKQLWQDIDGWKNWNIIFRWEYTDNLKRLVFFDCAENLVLVTHFIKWRKCLKRTDMPWLLSLGPVFLPVKILVGRQIIWCVERWYPQPIFVVCLISFNYNKRSFFHSWLCPCNIINIYTLYMYFKVKNKHLRSIERGKF